MAVTSFPDHQQELLLSCLDIAHFFIYAFRLRLTLLIIFQYLFNFLNDFIWISSKYYYHRLFANISLMINDFGFWIFYKCIFNSPDYSHPFLFLDIFRLLTPIIIRDFKKRPTNI